MTSRDFCFWLQGHFELNGSGEISANKADLIRRHLALVFKHEIDPSMGDTAHQSELNVLHAGSVSQSILDESPPTKPEVPSTKVVHVHHERPLIRC